MAQAALKRLLALGGELYTPPGQPRRKFDLAHMRALLAALGDPQHRFSSILVAGTNGKGSTCATLASILKESGIAAGLYTSPHLVRVNERIAIRGVEIDDDTLTRLQEQVEAAAARLIDAGTLPGLPSFFEMMTAIAMLAFADAGVDLAVLEVGMGGRLDATNVVEPLFSVITDISLDHTEWLGTTIAEIAREKAGILRQGGTMITLPQHPAANQALGEIAVPLDVRGINAADYLPLRDGVEGIINRYTLQVATSQGETTPLEVDSPLSGSHQQRNLALAIAAALELRNSYGYDITTASIEAGIANTHWAGRLERLRSPEGTEIVLDVAHNPAGAWALRSAFSAIENGRRSVLLFGAMRDKEVDEIAQILFPAFDRVLLIELPSPRAASLDQLAAAAEKTGAAFARFTDTETAYREALQFAGPDGLVFASGSVILIGALRSLLA